MATFVSLRLGKKVLPGVRPKRLPETIGWRRIPSLTARLFFEYQDSEIEHMATFVTIQLGKRLLRNTRKAKGTKFEAKAVVETVQRDMKELMQKWLSESREEAAELKRKESVETEIHSTLHKRQGDRVVALGDEFGRDEPMARRGYESGPPPTSSDQDVSSSDSPSVTAMDFGRPLQVANGHAPGTYQPGADEIITTAESSTPITFSTADAVETHRIPPPPPPLESETEAFESHWSGGIPQKTESTESKAPSKWSPNQSTSTTTTTTSTWSGSSWSPASTLDFGSYPKVESKPAAAEKVESSEPVVAPIDAFNGFTVPSTPPEIDPSQSPNYWSASTWNPTQTTEPKKPMEAASATEQKAEPTLAQPNELSTASEPVEESSNDFLSAGGPPMASSTDLKPKWSPDSSSTTSTWAGSSWQPSTERARPESSEVSASETVKSEQEEEQTEPAAATSWNPMPQKQEKTEITSSWSPFRPKSEQTTREKEEESEPITGWTPFRPKSESSMTTDIEQSSESVSATEERSLLPIGDELDSKAPPMESSDLESYAAEATDLSSFVEPDSEELATEKAATETTQSVPLDIEYPDESAVGIPGIPSKSDMSGTKAKSPEQSTQSAAWKGSSWNPSPTQEQSTTNETSDLREEDVEIATLESISTDPSAATEEALLLPDESETVEEASVAEAQELQQTQMKPKWSPGQASTSSSPWTGNSWSPSATLDSGASSDKEAPPKSELIPADVPASTALPEIESEQQADATDQSTKDVLPNGIPPKSDSSESKGWSVSKWSPDSAETQRGDAPKSADEPEAKRDAMAGSSWSTKTSKVSFRSWLEEDSNGGDLFQASAAELPKALADALEGATWQPSEAAGAADLAVAAAAASAAWAAVAASAAATAMGESPFPQTPLPFINATNEIRSQQSWASFPFNRYPPSTDEMNPPSPTLPVEQRKEFEHYTSPLVELRQDSPSSPVKTRQELDLQRLHERVGSRTRSNATPAKNRKKKPVVEEKRPSPLGERGGDRNVIPGGKFPLDVEESDDKEDHLSRRGSWDEDSSAFPSGVSGEFGRSLQVDEAPSRESEKAKQAWTGFSWQPPAPKTIIDVETEPVQPAAVKVPQPPEPAETWSTMPQQQERLQKPSWLPYTVKAVAKPTGLQEYAYQSLGTPGQAVYGIEQEVTVLDPSHRSSRLRSTNAPWHTIPGSSSAPWATIPGPSGQLASRKKQNWTGIEWTKSTEPN